MQMDVRDMSFFPEESFDSIIDKGMVPLPLDALYNVADFSIKLVCCMLTLFLLPKFAPMDFWLTGPRFRNS